MNKKFLATVAITLTGATSCSLFKEKIWSWDVSTRGYNINYCLLIGQLDHDDSMNRTKGIRDALDTRPDEAHQKKNFNMEDPKTGHLIFGGKDGVPPQEYAINELEHMEQKSFSGSCWDPITANATAGTWISKHGKNITMFVSNNDGMSEGALKAHNWYKGMPVFGYDANMSALKLVLADRIMGTIDSTTYGQCLANAILVRNIYEAGKKGADNMTRIERIYKGLEEFNGKKEEGNRYDPTLEGLGKLIDGEKITTELPYGSGYMQSDVTVTKQHAVLLLNRALTKEPITDGYKGFTSLSAKEFFKEEEDGSYTPLTYPEIYSKFEGKDAEAIGKPIAKPNPLETIRVWQSWGICSDVYFTSNMNLLFDIVFAKDMFNFDIIEAPGHGADEKEILDMLSSALSRPADQKPQAFLINVIRQPNSLQYVTKIADSFGLSKYPDDKDWIKRSDIPVIFWNRQPTNSEGIVSDDVMENNPYFKYVYYVGFDAAQGGELQGQMIVNWLNDQYVAHYQEKNK